MGGRRGGNPWSGGSSGGTPTSSATGKPKAILFVSKCFNQIVKTLYCLKMKAAFVGVIFHSSVLFSNEINKQTGCLGKQLHPVSVGASKSKGDASLFRNH